MVDTGVIEPLREVSILYDEVSIGVNGVERARPRNRRSFGETPLIDGTPTSAHVKGESPTTTFARTSWRFFPALDESPSISGALLVEPSGQLRRVENDPAG